ncbi:MAG: hypothetical protein ACMXYF_05020 [Candidatus Woesearchaeota archaeon]
MKMQNYFFIILLVLGFLVLSGCDFSMSSVSVSTDEEKYICQVDEDCVLTDLNLQRTCSACDPCTLIDYADENFISVNKEWLSEYKRSWIYNNCPQDFYRCSYEIDMGDDDYTDCLMRFFTCQECVSSFENTHYRAVCVDNVCQKYAS